VRAEAQPLNAATNPGDLDALALRLARQCRRIVQSCLREEEWADADLEFSTVIRAGLEELVKRPSSIRPASEDA
jgi:hypothetical protein